MRLRLAIGALLAGSLACSFGRTTPAPNPMPADAAEVFAGTSPDALHALEDEERAYFLARLQHCAWRHDPEIAARDPKWLYEVRGASGGSERVLSRGSTFCVAQSCCSLASAPASRLWRMAEPEPR